MSIETSGLNMEQASPQVEVVQKKLANTLQSRRVMKQALEITESIQDFNEKNHALTNIAQAQAEIGNFDDALQTIPLLSSNRTKANAYVRVATIQAKAGEDPQPTFDLAIKAAKGIRAGPMSRGDREQVAMNKEIAFSSIINAQLQLGLLDKASKTLKEADKLDPKWKNEKQRAIDQAKLALQSTQATNPDTTQSSTELEGDNSDDNRIDEVDIEAELQRARSRTDKENKSRDLLEIAKKQSKAGGDPSAIFKEAFTEIQGITSWWDKDILLSDLTAAQAQTDKIDDALITANQINDGENKVRALTSISVAVGKNGLSSTELQAIPTQVRNTLVKDNNYTAIQALGYFGLVDITDPTVAQSLTPQARISLIAGKSEQAKDVELLSEARRIALEADSSPAMKAFTDGLIATQDYEAVSNHLLGMLDHYNKNEGDNALEHSIRLLKGLIQSDNPKGKTIATWLFTNENLPPSYREYLARKLFEQKYWDPKLADYLQTGKYEDKPFIDPFLPRDRQLLLLMQGGGENAIKQNPVQSRSEQAQVLSTIIKDFGLVPDLPTYQLLEQPGALQADTLEGRVVELKERVKEFEGKSRDELLTLFRSSPEALKVFYVTKAGAYKYSIVNDYSLEKFRTVTERVAALRVHEPTLARFQEVLEGGGMDSNTAHEIIESLKAGKPVIKGENRTIHFSSAIEYGSPYEAAIGRLQEVWKNELKSLLVAKATGVQPGNITESLALLEDHDKVSEIQSKIYKLVKPLKLNEEKVSVDDINNIAKDLRGRLMQAYRSDKDQLNRIRDASNTDIIFEYLRDVLPSSAATAEWSSHLKETLEDIRKSRETKGARVADKRLELTFLDKNEDFIRALRFADAAQCCFNSSNENFAFRTYEYVTRLNKDPLSFMMDLKQAGSDEIQGFIFGRMGINPETKKPVIMLNGIYSQLKGQTIVDNILAIVEDQMGEKLGAESIVIASRYGGNISQPNGYERTRMPLEAVRALQDNNGNPETKTYDDIGVVANGQFSFAGYKKTL